MPKRKKSCAGKPRSTASALVPKRNIYGQHLVGSAKSILYHMFLKHNETVLLTINEKHKVIRLHDNAIRFKIYQGYTYMGVS